MPVLLTFQSDDTPNVQLRDSASTIARESLPLCDEVYSKLINVGKFNVACAGYEHTWVCRSLAVFQIPLLTHALSILVS